MDLLLWCCAFDKKVINPKAFCPKTSPVETHSYIRNMNVVKRNKIMIYKLPKVSGSSTGAEHLPRHPKEGFKSSHCRCHREREKGKKTQNDLELSKSKSSGKMVELSPYHPKVEGFSPAATVGTE
jgi:hypothetical protein